MNWNFSASWSWTDLVLAAWILLFVWLGWRRGLIKMVFHLLSFAAALAVSWMLYPVAAELLRSTALYGRILAAVKENFVTSSVSGVASETWVPEILKNPVEQSAATAAGGVAEYLSGLVLNVLCFMVILAAAKLIIAAAAKILDVFSSLPVIGFFNRATGMILGLAEGVLLGYLILALLYVVIPLRENQDISYCIQQSFLVQKMYTGNPLMRLMGAEAAGPFVQ